MQSGSDEMKRVVGFVLLVTAAGLPACRKELMPGTTGAGASGMVGISGAAGNGAGTGSGTGGAAGAANTGGGASDGGTSSGAGGSATGGTITFYDGGIGGQPGAPLPLGSFCVACTRMEINAPIWEPTGAIMFSTPLTSDQDYGALVQDVLVPNHVRYATEGVFGPGVIHGPPYDTELAGLAKALGPRQFFRRSTFGSPALSIVYMLSVVPRAGAPIGRSVDLTSGPMIPNALFPMRVEANLLGPPILDASFASTMPGYDMFSPAIDAEGASHFVLAFRTNSGFATDGAPGIGAYYLQIRIIDATGAGWDSYLRFDVVADIDL